jgi:flavin reductase (DIM6/NTAB) family NADH-FMN oxidoreductase RutF
MRKKTLSPKPWLFPRPVLLLSTRSAAEQDNILTVSWAGMACTQPPMLTVSLRKSRLSHATVLATREFVVNIPTGKQREAVELCGTSSGRDTDKFAETGLSRMPASLVAAPLIAECPINLECRVRHVLPLGSHDLFVAEIVKTHVLHAVLRDDGQINDQALDCMAWGSEEFFRVLTQRKHLLVPRFQ